jgi:capsular polysaccharide biosynthesis protein/Mrp family chromosome partitioning ATPase
VSEGVEEESVLREWLGVISRQRWLVLAAVLITPLLALVVSHSQQSIYQASSQVLVNEQTASASVLNPSSSATSPPDRYAATQAALARVATVAEMAVKAAGVPGHTAAGLLANSTVSSDPNDDLLTFSVSDPNPADAQRLANSYAKQFTVYRRTLDTEALTSAIADTQQKLAAIAAAGSRGSALYLQLKANERDLQALQTLEAAGSGAVVVNTSDRASQTEPKTSRNVILGLLVGLTLGLVAAFLRESLDVRVRSAEELAERLGMRLLGEVPVLGRSRTETDQPGMLLEPNAPSGKFTLAAGNLEIARNQHGVRSILITSVDDEEGKSQVAANLAMALSHMGVGVVLLDLDLAHPNIEGFFGLSGQPGLHDLAPDKDFDSVLHAVDVPGAKLEVMTAGTARPLPVQFLWSSTVPQALAALPDQCDVLLVNGPPLARGGEALRIAGLADALLVVAPVHARRARVSDGRHALEAFPARALGVIATRKTTDFSRLRSVVTTATSRWNTGQQPLPADRPSQPDGEPVEGTGSRRPTLVESEYLVSLKRAEGHSPPAGR